MIEMEKLQKSINQASKDCIAEGKRHQFPVFLNIPNPDDRTGKLISRPIQVTQGDDHSEDDDDEEEDEEEIYLDIPAEIDADVESNTMISTKLYGTLNFRTAETFFLNGGRSSLSTKTRLSRFTGDAFGISSDIRLFNQNPCRCRSSTRIGQKIRLTTFADASKQVTGDVRFISYKGAPLKFYCSEHSLISG